MTTEPDEKDKTAPIELPHPSGPLPPGGSPSQSSSVEVGDSFRPLQPGEADSAPFGERPREAVETPTDSVTGTEAAARPSLIPRAVSAGQQDVMFVPLAVSIGDGFKFGCGFFLAMVLALLVAFVLLALLFVVTSLFGLNLPISR